MTSNPRSSKVTKIILLAACLILAGSLYWSFCQSGSPDAVASPVSGDKPAQTADASTVSASDATRTKTHAAVAGVSPSANPAQANTASATQSTASSSSSGSRHKPMEPAEQIDFSTHYVLINGHRAHPRHLLAKYKSSAKAQDLQSLLARHQLQEKSIAPNASGIIILDAPHEPLKPVSGVEEARLRGELMMEKIKDLHQSGQFEYVEPDYIRTIDATPSDQSFTDGTLWGLRNTGQSSGVVGADIDAVRAWDTTTGSTDVIVAVIDTGIRYTHQDLSAQMWQNPGEIAGNGADDDGDGYVDNVYGINAITNSGNPMDDHGHGSHTAGTIGASANGGGQHVGVAWSVKLMACKFLSANGGGSTADAIKCISFAVSKGARILSNSWGGGGYSQALADAITTANNAGVLFVAAAGNSATNNDITPSYPASYTNSNIISVAAIDRQDRLASFSCYGANSVDLGAPGVSIFSCISTSDTSYATWNGTSMATPHVSGVAALVLANSPGLSVDELRQRILGGTVPITALTGKCATGGRLNAYNSLTGEPDGTLEVSASPASGSSLLGGTAVPFYVQVRDFNAVNDATVTASLNGGTPVTFSNNGTAPDTTANDNTYSTYFSIPSAGTTITLALTVTAPGKTTHTSTLNYTIILPPANDAFANRITLSGNTPTATGTNIAATKETGEPNHAGYTGGKSVWWTWTASANGTATIATTGSTFDTLLGIYTGSAVNALTLIAGDDDSGGGYGASRVTFPTTAGTTYHIAVDGFGGSTGNIALAVTLIPTPVAPANDNFANASTLTGSSASATGNNLIATKETGEPNHAGNTGGKSVWWTWTAPTTGIATLTTDGSTFDTLLAVYTGSSVSALTAIISDNDSGDGTCSQVIFNATAGTTYRIAIDGYNGSNGSIALALTLTTPPAAPANDNFANASILTGSSASATGTNISATKETGEPDHAQNSGGRSVWWTWTAPGEGTVTLTTAGSNFNTLLAVYTGTTVNALTLVAANDEDSLAGNTSRVIFNVTAGTTYHIAVDGVNSGLQIAIGSIALALTHTTTIIPPNDAFADRIPLTGTTLTATGFNINATRETGEPYHYSSSASKSVWWRWTAPTSGTALINTDGSTFDTVLAIYTGSAVNALSYIASDNDSGDGTCSQVIFTATAGATYQIAVAGYGGTSGNISLNINPATPAPVITTQPANQNRYPGDSISFYVSATSSTPMTYQWRKDGVALTDGGRISGSTYNYLNIYTAQASDAGSYTVVITNLGGTTTSTPATLTVTTPPPPTITTHPATQTPYLGETLSLSVSSSITGTTTYQWQKSTDSGATYTAITGATYSSYSIYPTASTDAGLYRVIVTNPGGSTTSNAATITFQTPPPPTISYHPTGATLVGGNSLYLYATATGRGYITYQWQKDGVALVNGSRISGATSSTLSIYNVRVADAGQYRLVATNAGGSATSNAATIAVTAPAAPTISSPPSSTTVTAGNSAYFYAYASGVVTTYQWQKDGVNLVNGGRISGANSYYLTISNTQTSDAGQYRLVVSNDGGSATSTAATLTITLPPPPSFYTQPTGATLLEGASLSLYAYASGSGTITYQWYKDNTAITGATSSTYSKTAVTTADAGTYKVTATNAGGTVTSNNASVIINAATAPAFVIHPQGTAACAGDIVALASAATSNPAATYQWYKNGTAVSGATANNLTLTAQLADTGAVYTVRATNIAGSAISAPATLTVYAAGSTKVLGLYPATRVVGAGRVVYPLTLRANGTWTATKTANWIALSTATGTNSRTLEITVAPNPLPVERTATITFGDLTHTLTQRAAGTPIAELWATGDNTTGQLGDTSLPTNPYPDLANTSVRAIAASRNHTLFIKTDNTLWAMGYNGSGQLGDGTTINRRDPVQIATNVQSVATGTYHTHFIKTDGTLWATGNNYNGQLGDRTTTSRNTPVQIATNVSAVSCGSSHTLFVKTDGTLWATGSNYDGQLGNGTTTNLSTPAQIATGVSSVAAGGYHTHFIKTDNTLWACGHNSSGQLGNGTYSNVIIPAQIATGIRAASAGSYHTHFIKTDNTLMACGYNSDGQLGDSTYYSRSTPVQIATNVQTSSSAYQHTLFVKTDGTLWATGDNTYHELGDGTATQRLTPVQVATNVQTAAAGDDHSLFVKTDNTLWAMGTNLYGQIGSATAAVEMRSTPICVASEVRTAAAGDNHSLFVKTDGTGWSVGGNTYGQLADGSTTPRTQPARVATALSAVSAGDNHSLFLKQDGTLLAAGYNYSGQLGDTTYVNRSTPVAVTTVVSAISAGANHSLLLKTNNTLLTVGFNTYGQLGNGSYARIATPVSISTTAKSMAAGANHSLVIKTDNTLWTCGYNSNGQLGNGTSNTSNVLAQVAGAYTAVAAGYAHSLLLKTDGTATAAGYNGYGQLGDGTFSAKYTPVQTLTGVSAIAAGKYHSFYLKTDNTLWGTGDGSSGQLGKGNTSIVITPTKVAANITAVSAGVAHSLFLANGDIRPSYVAPTISTFSPGTPAAGATVTINGTGYNSVLGVYFNNVPATSYTTGSSTQITAVAPTADLSNLTITVATFDGVVSSNNPNGGGSSSSGGGSPPPSSGGGGGGGAPGVAFLAALAALVSLRLVRRR